MVICATWGWINSRASNRFPDTPNPVGLSWFILHPILSAFKRNSINEDNRWVFQSMYIAMLKMLSIVMFWLLSEDLNKTLTTLSIDSCPGISLRFLSVLPTHWTSLGSNSPWTGAQKIHRTISHIYYKYINIHVYIYIWLFPFNPCPEGKVWLEVWFGGMIRGYDSGYDSRVWFAAPKTFISALAGNWALSLCFTGPAHYQLN